MTPLLDNTNVIDSQYIDNEEAISKHKLWLQGFLDNALISIIALKAIRDADQKITDFEYVFINKKAEESVKKAGLKGQRFAVEFPGSNLTAMFHQYVHVTETGNPWEDEVYYEFDTHAFWAAVKATKHEDGCLIMYNDITEKKRAAVDQKRASLILDNINDACYQLDKKGNILYVNKKAELLLNKTKEEMLGKNLWSIFPESENPYCYESIQVNALENNKFCQIEYISAVTRTWISLSAKPTDDGCIVLFHEIEDIKKSQELKESKELLQSVLDISINSVTVLKSLRNKNGEIFDFEWIMANKTVEDRLKKGSLEGARYTEIYEGVRENGWLQRFIDVVETGVQAEFETSFTLYGVEDWYHILAQKFRDGLVVTSNKITQRKKAEEEIKEQAHFIRQIANTTPDILYVYDLVDKKIIFVNNEVLQTLGYTPEKIYALGNRFFEFLMQPEDFSEVMSHLVNLSSIRPGEVREINLRTKDVNGKFYWYNVRNTFFKEGANGKTRQILGIAQNITDKKEMEAAFFEEKTRNVELKRMIELMDTFVYASAHDLKAPVSNLRLVSDVIDNTDNTELKLQLLRKYTPIIESLDQTIHGLIKVLEIEKDATACIKRIRFKEVVNTITNEFYDKMALLNPEVNIDFKNCPSVLYVESYLISIFRNLFSNALKYHASERRLVINIHTRYTGKFVLITFSDNGIGIDLNIYGKDLFKPFKRFSAQSNGSGIGLHLVKSMVSKNGGKVEIESIPGGGTTFKLYIVQHSNK